MDCPDARALISARVDGEVDSADGLHLTEHLDSCATCRHFEERVHALRRAAVMNTVAEIPDLTSAVLRRAGAPDAGRGEWVRIALGSIAATLVLLNVPLLVSGDEAGATPHVGRHLGAFGMALAIGFGYAALRPERSIGLVPMMSALGVTFLVTGVVDAATGSSTVLDETTHMLELAGIVALWWLSGGRHRLGERVGRLRSTRHSGLRLIS
ncbi:MAG: zf-HC2 domain-containing protein [Acidimicrobiales bacterium]